MNKENGRLKPAEKEEFATIKDKRFECEECGDVLIVENVVFGGHIYCARCGGLMKEKI